jgi:8-oxo-dGTP pyrophosphatase MutT (NUDIX family)
LPAARFLESLSPSLRHEQPARLVPGRSAAVAIVFHTRGVECILLIKRAERQGDPWSGQMAFPGGMTGRHDSSFEETARRETAEEVGIDLSSKAANFMGYMPQLKAKMREILVVPCVYELREMPKLVLNAEVASAAWVPLKRLARSEARSRYLLQRDGLEIPFPSLVHEGLVIWGLTERILSTIIGSPPEATTSADMEDVEKY